MARKYRKPNFPNAALEEMEKLEKTVKKPLQLKRIQSILFAVRNQMNAKEISTLLCIHEVTVKKYWAFYRKNGISFIQEEKRGSGRGKKYLTFIEEEEFLKSFLNKAKKGGILTVSIVHKALEKKLGHKVNESTTYRMLYRHNWRKIVPRKYHPKTNIQKQEEFKTNFKTNLDKFKKNSQRKET